MKKLESNIDCFFNNEINIPIIELQKHRTNSDNVLKNSPYITKYSIHEEIEYNPNYGDDKECECGVCMWM